MGEIKKVDDCKREKGVSGLLREEKKIRFRIMEYKMRMLPNVLSEQNIFFAMNSVLTKYLMFLRRAHCPSENIKNKWRLLWTVPKGVSLYNKQSQAKNVQLNHCIPLDHIPIFDCSHFFLILTRNPSVRFVTTEAKHFCGKNRWKPLYKRFVTEQNGRSTRSDACWNQKGPYIVKAAGPWVAGVSSAIQHLIRPWRHSN